MFLGAWLEIGIKYFNIVIVVVRWYVEACRTNFGRLLMCVPFENWVFMDHSLHSLNKRSGSRLILERLDRALCTPDWFHLLMKVGVQHLS